MTETAAAMVHAASTVEAPSPNLLGGQGSGVTQNWPAPETSLENGQIPFGNRDACAVLKPALDGDQYAPDTQRERVPAVLDGDHLGSDAHKGAVPANLRRGQSGHVAQQRSAPPSLSGSLLLIFADAVDDLERTRIATENRLRSLRQIKGLGGSREELRLIALIGSLSALEHGATLDLQRAMRAHPLGPWVKRTIGIGEKQGARLLAAIGDPASRSNPAKLWAYCGYKPGQKHQRGVQSNWNSTAKMRAYLCAESCMKNRRSPYREVYDREREKWADRDTSDGHKHNHALRVVAKAILRDLWREARTQVHPTPIDGASVSPAGASDA